MASADYWKRQLRSKVRFREALDALRASSSKRLILVEVGCAPHLVHIVKMSCVPCEAKSWERAHTDSGGRAKLFAKGVDLLTPSPPQSAAHSTEGSCWLKKATNNGYKI